MDETTFNKVFKITDYVKEIHLATRGLDNDDASRYFINRYSYDQNKDYSKDLEALSEILRLIWKDMHLILNEVNVLLGDLEAEQNRDKIKLIKINIGQCIDSAHKIIHYMNSIIFNLTGSDDMMTYNDFVNRHTEHDQESFGVGDLINKSSDVYISILEKTDKVM